MPGSFDLVIFDCDGVLVDSEAIDDEVLVELMAELGVAMTPADVHRLTSGLAERDIWVRLVHEYGVEIPAHFAARYEIVALEAMKKRLQPIRGVRELLEQLTQAGMPICVASSGSHTKMDVTLEVTGLAPFFEGNIFSATQVAHGKPAPDLFLFAAERMSTPPAHCAVVEDSFNGARAGLGAGMTVFGYTNQPAESRLDRLGITLFSEMTDLPGLLGLTTPR